MTTSGMTLCVGPPAKHEEDERRGRDALDCLEAGGAEPFLDRRRFDGVDGLSITHNFCSEHDAEGDVGEAR